MLGNLDTNESAHLPVSFMEWVGWFLVAAGGGLRLASYGRWSILCSSKVSLYQ
jgi:hypothetical protein